MELDQLRELLGRVDALKDKLYDLPGGGCGGPLHIFLDDGNCRNDDVVFCYQQCFGADVEPEMKAAGLAIIYEVLRLTEAQRWLWWEGKDVEEIAARAGARLTMDDADYYLDGDPKKGRDDVD